MRELIIRKDPSLLDNFLEEVISFLGDSSSHVKQFVIAFLEEAWYVILIGNRDNIIISGTGERSVLSIKNSPLLANFFIFNF